MGSDQTGSYPFSYFQGTLFFQFLPNIFFSVSFLNACLLFAIRKCNALCERLSFFFLIILVSRLTWVPCPMSARQPSCGEPAIV